MIKNVTRIFLAAVTLGSSAGVAVADEVPRLDVARTCRAEASADPGQAAAASCMADEQKAREQLIKDWEGFAASTKSGCSAEATGAGIQSYVELLTCLQVARDAGKLPKE